MEGLRQVRPPANGIGKELGSKDFVSTEERIRCAAALPVRASPVLTSRDASRNRSCATGATEARHQPVARGSPRKPTEAVSTSFMPAKATVQAADWRKVRGRLKNAIRKSGRNYFKALMGKQKTKNIGHQECLIGGEPVSPNGPSPCFGEAWKLWGCHFSEHTCSAGPAKLLVLLICAIESCPRDRI